LNNGTLYGLRPESDRKQKKNERPLHGSLAKIGAKEIRDLVFLKLEINFK